MEPAFPSTDRPTAQRNGIGGKRRRNEGEKKGRTEGICKMALPISPTQNSGNEIGDTHETSALEVPANADKDCMTVIVRGIRRWSKVYDKFADVIEGSSQRRGESTCVAAVVSPDYYISKL